MAKPRWKEVQAVRRDRLANVLAADGRSQTVFAQEVLGSKARRGDLCRWLSLKGKRVPSTDDYLKIADATGSSVDWLLGRSEAADRDGPPSLSAARRVVLESTVDQLMKDAEVQARHREPATVSQKALCKGVALEAVVRVFRTPALVQRAREAYLTAFDSWLRDEERLELHRLRREAGRRRSSAGGTTTGTTKAR